MAAETFAKSEMIAAVDAAMAGAYRQCAARIAELEAALGEVLAGFADPMAKHGSENPDSILRSNWIATGRVRAWRTTLAGAR